MKKIRFNLTAITVIAFLLFPTKTVQAHPADLYAHTITIDLSQTDMQIEWQIKPGPLLVNFLWNEMDANQDGSV
ncbi:MAG TPA: hypothetical protein PK152_09150, partial [Anaerolineales bacterium]|nr:hypothetical protein [Anaerolineales bacterium]